MKLYINNDIQNQLSEQEKDNAYTIIKTSFKQIDEHHRNITIFLPEDFFSTSLLEGVTIRDWLNSQNNSLKNKVLSLVGKQRKWSKSDSNISNLFLIANQDDNDIVCENALGHCWHRKIITGDDAVCYSLDEVKWSADTITVEEKKDDGTSEHPAKIKNYKHDTIEPLSIAIHRLLNQIPSLNSWEETYEYLFGYCKHVFLCADSFSYMYSYPFSKSVSDQIIRLISILEFIETHSVDGVLDETGNEVYQQHFNKENADFSSERGIFKFKSVMSDGKKREQDNFPFHGKIEGHHDPIRIHFTWPRIKGLPINILYVGCKLTKK
jgi:hypothetical protein